MTQRSGKDGSGTQPCRSTSAEVRDDTAVLMMGPTRPIPSRIAAGSRKSSACTFSRPVFGTRSMTNSRTPMTAKNSTTMTTAKEIFPTVELEWARSLSQFTEAPLPSMFDRKSVTDRTTGRIILIRPAVLVQELTTTCSTCLLLGPGRFDLVERRLVVLVAQNPLGDVLPERPRADR